MSRTRMKDEGGKMNPPSEAKELPDDVVIDVVEETILGVLPNRSDFARVRREVRRVCGFARECLGHRETLARMRQDLAALSALMRSGVTLTVMNDQETRPRSGRELECLVERWLEAMPADDGVFAEPGEGTPCRVRKVGSGWAVEAPGTGSGEWRGRVRRNAARAVIRAWEKNRGDVERATGEGRN